MNKERALQAVDRLYKENGGALQELAKIEREELKIQLENLKKENFQKIVESRMNDYQEKYGSLPDESEYWRFIVSEYYGTGNGETICIMVTQGSTEPEDFTEDSKYTPINSIEYRCVREFHKHFGTWMLHGIEFLSKEDFFKKYSIFLPQALVNLKNQQCYMHYHSELHFNFS